MIIADSHVHVHELWFEPVETLLYEMDRNEVQHAVLIQDLDETDNSYQFDCVRRFPGRFSSVVYVDTDRPDAPRRLERLAEQGAVGVRWFVATRSPGDDPLAVWRAAERLGLAVSCPGRTEQLATAETLDLLRALPNLRVVIEHLGSGSDPVQHAAMPPEERRRVYARLASFPNVFMKFHGLAEFCRRAVPHTAPFPFVQPIPPTLELAYEAFGSGRLMWGSDFPPVGIREGYRNALRFPLEQFRDKSDADRAQMFGATALQVFPIRV